MENFSKLVTARLREMASPLWGIKKYFCEKSWTLPFDKLPFPNSSVQFFLGDTITLTAPELGAKGVCTRYYAMVI